jgi:hypothetical protein
LCETSNPTQRVIDEPSAARITGRHRPDCGTIGETSADGDYRMSPSHDTWSSLW